MNDSSQSVLAVAGDIPLNKDGSTIGKIRRTEGDQIAITVTDRVVADAMMGLPGAAQAFSIRPFDTEQRFEQDIDCSTKTKPVPNVPWYHKFRK